jgi:hypothetical protein
MHCAFDGSAQGNCVVELDPSGAIMSEHSIRAKRAMERSDAGHDAGIVLTLQSSFRLDRALTRRLSHRYGSGPSMRPALRLAIGELVAMGMAENAIVSLLAQTVEQAAALLGVAKRSIVTGQPDWLSTQIEVVDFARSELRVLALLGQD